jgi:hypothetical protein
VCIADMDSRRASSFLDWALGARMATRALVVLEAAARVRTVDTRA